MGSAIKSMDLEKVLFCFVVAWFLYLSFASSLTFVLFVCLLFSFFLFSQISKTMDQFEKNLEDLDIHSNV